MNNSFTIALSGQAGQGIQTVEKLLTRILKLSGYHVYANKEYMSRVRGGVNSTTIRISSQPVRALANSLDLLIALDPGRTKHLSSRITKQTIVVEDVKNNIEAIGLVLGLLKLDQAFAQNYIEQRFKAKGDKVIEANNQSLAKGYKNGQALIQDNNFKLELKANQAVKEEILCNGAEAVALGAIAGGCNFISAYPMSPSTGVFVYLSQQAKAFGLVAEQAEDEISAVNMNLGAWYAGARALVSTSGGGFALMQEGTSLAGMTETPLVVHLAQRPGPATGLPTRTEQGDLNLVLYSGHGDFPRIILTPGSIKDAFELTQAAFNLADKFQVPVFILTDQYLMDSYYNLPKLPLNQTKVEPAIVETGKDYQRYVLTKNGISPRGIPGFGQGLVGVDSDEHDESGHITEDLELRNKMVEKRLNKEEAIKASAIEPELIGPEDYETLLVAWGSTYEPIKEALAEKKTQKIALLYFKQVYPLPSQTIDYLKRAKKVVAIENNATGQFADLIKLKTGFEIKERILKYNGLAFAVDELREKLYD